jgi:hypothetical protein
MVYNYFSDDELISNCSCNAMEGDRGIEAEEGYDPTLCVGDYGLGASPPPDCELEDESLSSLIALWKDDKVDELNDAEGSLIDISLGLPFESGNRQGVVDLNDFYQRIHSLVFQAIDLVCIIQEAGSAGGAGIARGAGITRNRDLEFPSNKRSAEQQAIILPRKKKQKADKRSGIKTLPTRPKLGASAREKLEYIKANLDENTGAYVNADRHFLTRWNKIGRCFVDHCGSDVGRFLTKHRLHGKSTIAAALRHTLHETCQDCKR